MAKALYYFYDLINLAGNTRKSGIAIRCILEELFFSVLLAYPVTLGSYHSGLTHVMAMLNLPGSIILVTCRVDCFWYLSDYLF